MTTKSMIYDNPAYIARLHQGTGNTTAGASGLSSKFVAWANMIVFSVTATLATVGNSTYTQWNGTSTVTGINGQSFNVIRVFNTASAGLAVAMATSTYGPFWLGPYNGTATGTQTAQVGHSVNVALSGTATGAAQAGSNANPGGFTINQGDQLWVIGGTDTAAVANYTFELGVQPMANVTA